MGKMGWNAEDSRSGKTGWIRTIMRAGAAMVTVCLSLIMAASFWLILSKVWLKTPVPSVFGFSPVYVLSGSMEPEFSAGDMIVIHPRPIYQLGDVVTFYSEGELVTHRIIGESRNGFTMKGDANNVRDEEPVGETDIVGELVFVLPGLGSIAMFFRTPRGILALAALVLLTLVQTFRQRSAGQKNGTENKESQ